MLLRATILILLVVNLGVAAWWWAGGAAPPASPAPTVEPAPTLQLVSELPARASTAPLPLADAAPEVGAPGPSASVAVRCVRLGPFADAAARDGARALLEPVAERVSAREVPARAGRGWRVVLPPLGSREEASATAERMRAAGVSDLYVLNDGADANAIALGRYGSEDAARRREADLRGRGFPAVAEALGGGTPQWWLDARLRAGADPATLPAAGAAREIACASLR